MAKTIYTAEAHVTGGRTHGHGRSSDGNLDVQLRPPTDNAEHGTNPEQLFAVGYAACFEGALAAVGRRQKIELGDVAIDASVSQDGAGAQTTPPYPQRLFFAGFSVVAPASRAAVMSASAVAG